MRRADANSRSFASKAAALNLGIASVADVDYEFLGCLDADITLEPSYYEKVLGLFAANPVLGVAGGFVFEPVGQEYRSRPYNTTRSVPGAIQLFRRSCFPGAYLFLPYGGEDTIAEVAAQMAGYEVRSFPELRVYHHRPTGGSEKPVRACFRAGLQHYYMGYSPLYEVLASLRRIRSKPAGASFVLRTAGFVWGSVRRMRRPVPRDHVSYLRKRQLSQVLDNLKEPLRRGVRTKV